MGALGWVILSGSFLLMLVIAIASVIKDTCPGILREPEEGE